MKQSRFRVFWTLAFALMLTLLTTGAYAQNAASSSLSGTVVDASGGVVPGADVLVKHNGTGTEFRAVSDATGRYTIPAMIPGTYTVTVTLMGFKTVVLPDVQVIGGTAAAVKPVVLEVGKVEETVTVTGATEIVQTQSAAVTTTLSTTQITKVPLPTRNVLDFVTMLPGVNTTTTLRGSSVMGLPGSALNITIDGLNTQDQALKSTAGSSFFTMINPRLDAVEEVTASTANPGAESSGQGSVQIRFQTRAGTNKFQGSVYDYMRRTNWNTNFWFNDHGNYPKLQKDKNRIDTFGFRVGGPVVTDKLFYFFNYEEFRQPMSRAPSRTVLTDASMRGDFVYTGNSQPVNLFTVAARYGMTATPDPAIMQMLNDIHATLDKGSIKDGTNPLTNAFSFVNNASQRRIYPTTRIDYNLTANNRIGGSFYLQRFLASPDILNNADPAFPGYKLEGDQNSWRPAVMGNWRSTLGANLVNEVRAGYTSWIQTEFYTNVTPDMYPGGTYLSVPLVSTPFVVSSWEKRAAPLLNVDDTLSWLKGKHAFTFGASFTKIRLDQIDKSPVPYMGIGFDNNNDPAKVMFDTVNFPGATASDLSSARSLYALLTGRVTSINNNAYLSDAGSYVYNGPSHDLVSQKEYGVFAQDAWRVKPNLTVNAGVRWELQLPFVSTNHYFTRLVDYNMLSGISGTTNGQPNYFQPGSTAGASLASLCTPKSDGTPVYNCLQELTPGEAPFKTDWNNIAPSGGIAWKPAIASGSFWSKIFSTDPVFRAGYSKAFIREGLSTVTGIFGANPGGSIVVNRNQGLQNLIPAGESWPLLLRETSRLGPPPFPNTPTYPLTPSFDDSINAFDPNTQTPWVHSFNVSFQRVLTKDTAVDIRYVGTRSRGGWVSGGRNINERDIVENGFVDEFRHAQANYLINEQTYGWNSKAGNSFAFNNLPGQFLLPIFQGFYTGNRNNTTYNASQYTNTSYLGALVPTNPNVSTLASPLFTDGTFRQNGINAGYPANFFFMNPSLNGGVWVTGREQDAQQNNYDAAQIELRRRMSGGLLIQGSYQYVIRSVSTNYVSVRVGPEWTTSSSPKHALKLNWTYELPFGQGKYFAGGVSRNWNRLVGGWTFDGMARIQSGNILDFGNVLLVGMTDADLQNIVGLRMAPDATNPNITRVFYLPQDVIDNTIRAFNTSYFTANGYSSAAGTAATPSGTPTGRYFAPIQSQGCIQIYAGSCGTPTHHYVTGPRFVRFDMSVAKRMDITSRIYGEIRLEALNVFNAINFYGTATDTSITNNSYALSTTSGAYRDLNGTQDPGGRMLQLSWRVSW